VIPLAVIYEILGALRDEAIDGAERPQDDQRTEFGFGRVAGTLQLLREVRDRIESHVENKDRRDNDPAFEA